MAVESALRQRVCRMLRDSGFMVQPIETGAIVEGVPDVWYCHEGIAGWLELKKVQEMPKKPTTAVFKSLNHPLSNEQANWIYMARRHGSRADILVAYERDYFLVPGGVAESFNDFTEGMLRCFQTTKHEVIMALKVGMPI
jgi:hypothetical protein